MIGLGGLRAPVTVVGEVLGRQRVRNCINSDLMSRALEVLVLDGHQ